MLNKTSNNRHHHLQQKQCTLTPRGGNALHLFQRFQNHMLFVTAEVVAKCIDVNCEGQVDIRGEAVLIFFPTRKNHDRPKGRAPPNKSWEGEEIHNTGTRL